jgi:hypothetical protein
MRVYFGLETIAAYFYYNCSLIKVYLIADYSAQRVVGAMVVSSGVGVKATHSASNGKQGPITKEMSQTLPTNLD